MKRKAISAEPQLGDHLHKPKTVNLNYPYRLYATNLKEEQIIGLLIILGCVSAALLYGWLLYNWPILVLQITVYVVLLIVLAIIGWIGWSMLTASGKPKNSSLNDQQQS